MSQGEENDSLDYSALLLGNSMETILESTEAEIPRMPESRFINEVLPLLERPFYHSSMVQYTRFVRELTNALRVHADGNPQEILFEVPPFIQTTGVTLPVKGAPTTDTTLRNIYIEADRGVDVNPIVASFMSRITHRPKLQETLLDPLKKILERYGRVIDISDEKNQIDTPELAAAKTAAATPGVPVEPKGDSSFTGEYE
jgi:hypothetical protein